MPLLEYDSLDLEIFREYERVEVHQKYLLSVVSLQDEISPENKHQLLRTLRTAFYPTTELEEAERFKIAEKELEEFRKQDYNMIRGNGRPIISVTDKST